MIKAANMLENSIFILLVILLFESIYLSYIY